jgi:hypothetical protein
MNTSRLESRVTPLSFYGRNVSSLSAGEVPA